MVAKISQTQRVRPSIVPQDITTARTGSYVDISGAQRALLAVNGATVAATKKITLRVLQAKDLAGTGAKDLVAASDVVAPTGGAALAPLVDVPLGDIDTANGYAFIAAYLLSDNASAVYAGAVFVLSGNRYNP